MEQTLVVEKNLGTWQQNFNYVLYSIKESNDVNISIDELYSSLLMHEQRINVKKISLKNNLSKSPMQ